MNRFLSAGYEQEVSYNYKFEVKTSFQVKPFFKLDWMVFDEHFLSSLNPGVI